MLSRLQSSLRGWRPDRRTEGSYLPVKAYRGWGALACAFYAIHGSFHLTRGHPEELLWACHLGALWVGIGLLIRRPAFHAIGFLWLCVGSVLWGVYLASGGEFIPTSLLTHVGGLVVGGLAVLFLGLPRHSWWRAILAFLVLQQLCRFATPAHANINLAHSVWPGWETIFPSYLGYQVFLLAVGSASFALVEWLTRLLIEPEHAVARPDATKL